MMVPSIFRGLSNKFQERPTIDMELNVEREEAIGRADQEGVAMPIYHAGQQGEEAMLLHVPPRYQNVDLGRMLRRCDCLQLNNSHDVLP